MCRSTFVRTTALIPRKWPATTGAKTLYVESGSPWENGYYQSFNPKLKDEFLSGEIFYLLKEVQVLAERWRVHYNTVRPHSSLGSRPLAPAARLKQTNTVHETKMGYGKVETKHASHFSTPPTAANSIAQTLRYTNNSTGTKPQAGHYAGGGGS